MATRKQIPLIPTDSELEIADAKTVSFGHNFTHTGADVEVIGSGAAEITFPSSNDTILGRASIDSITGLKTFDSTKIAIKGSSTGITSIASANNGATDYTATLPAKDGTIAMTSDIPSLADYVTIDQTVGQTIGDTTNRLTKLWAIDITCTNAITGSVTGNAGTVTNATLTTALTVNTGTVTLTGDVAGSVLTIGAGAVSVSGSNTGDNADNTTSNSYADGKVEDNITDGHTTIAPSGNAVFDALALKANLISPSFTTPNIGAATGSSLALEGTTLGILTLKNTAATSYTRMLFDGTGTDFSVGVGNASAAIADLQNKFYIYDFTNSKIAFTIVPNTLAAKFYGAVETVGSATIGGTLALGTNSLTMTGSIGATGARVTKGWFTDVESTNMPKVGGTAILTSLTAPKFTTIELGHASDTTISRSAAGVIAVEGVVIPSISSTNTLTNKRVTPRVYSTTTASSVTPAIGTYDRYFYTALATAFTINAPSATPTKGEVLAIYITDNGTPRAITWNAKYKALGAALPTTTVSSKTLEIIATYNGTDWLTTTGQLV